MGREPIILAIFPRKPQEIKTRKYFSRMLTTHFSTVCHSIPGPCIPGRGRGRGWVPNHSNHSNAVVAQCTHVFLIKSSSTMVNLANVELSLHDYELSLEILNPSPTDDEVCKQRDWPWLWNPGQILPEIQNSITGPTKRTYKWHLQIDIYLWLANEKKKHLIYELYSQRTKHHLVCLVFHITI